MGSLLAEVPYGEVTGALENLAAGGVTREHLRRLRLGITHPATLRAITTLLLSGHPDDPICGDVLPHADDDFRIDTHGSCTPKGWTWNSQEFEQGLIRPNSRDLRFKGTWQNRMWNVFDKNKPLHSSRHYPSTAHILDLLLGNPSLIRLKFKSKRILFPGTVYIRIGAMSDPYHYRALVWDPMEESWGDEYVSFERPIDWKRDLFSTYYF